MIALMMCDDCNVQMDEVFYAEENRFRGWVCPACLTFAPAIGREHKWQLSDKVENDGDQKRGV